MSIHYGRQKYNICGGSSLANSSVRDTHTMKALHLFGGCMSIHLSALLSVCLYVCLSVCLSFSVHLSVCLSGTLTKAITDLSR